MISTQMGSTTDQKMTAVHGTLYTISHMLTCRSARTSAETILSTVVVCLHFSLLLVIHLRDERYILTIQRCSTCDSEIT
jgi:hypothetical protein